MGRYTGPVCRLCRREGTNLYLKGARCYGNKCAIVRRDGVPGMHQFRRGKASEYAIRLREKQKVKRYYGIFERQFRKYYAEAVRKSGNTGDTLMSLLERRLRAEVALFYSDYEDIQMFRLSSDGVTGSVDNGGTAHVKGVDWAFEWQATEQLLLELGGNVSDTEIVKLLPGVAAVIEGDPIDFSTDYTVRVAGTYAFDWAAGMPGFVRLDYSRIGPSHTTDRSIPVPILYQSEVNDLVNARLGLQWNRWSFELYGDNLTDENRLQDPAGGFGFGSRPRPRTIGLQVRAMTE